MEATGYIHEAFNYASSFNFLDFAGLVFGLLCVWFLIRQNMLTWPTGIIYVLISLVIFIKAKLYADFILHVVFLILNIYGWYYWKHPSKEDSQLAVTRTHTITLGILLLLSVGLIYITGHLLATYTDASVPFWDSTTSVLSVIAMWLTAKKKIENWALWLVVNILATGIYFYKGIYFYCILYLVYIGMAVAGYISWRKSMSPAPATV